MTDLADVAELASLNHGRCVFSTPRGDGSVQASVVNAGVLQHPLTGGWRVVGLVATGGSRKLNNLRADLRATIADRADGRWASVEGRAEIIGPEDPHPVIGCGRDLFRRLGDANVMAAPDRSSGRCSCGGAKAAGASAALLVAETADPPADRGVAVGPALQPIEHVALEDRRCQRLECGAVRHAQ
jgi:Pyridoxamine 5'-phosphate oxidase